MKECIDNCSECHAVCLQAVAHCLAQGGDHATEEHIRLLLDCAQACQTSADFMLRSSTLFSAVCGACAEVCERCADSCERFQDDRQMVACAEVCRKCAASCREMAAA
jgi:hypothetical protein